VTGYVVIASDLSERQALERMKDELISVVSHELRTPLTSIKGALGLLAGGTLQKSPERAGRMVQIASENTDRLMRLVNDSLDLERMQFRQLAFDKSLVDTAELMRQSVDSVRTIAESAGVSVVVSPVSETIHADAGRIVQSFTNLLSNAIKFSPREGVVNFTADAASTNIIFRVTDQGRGIPADKLETIFERFQQVDASDSRDKGGTGLGLAITRSIVQQHDGEVWAESALGRGSTFFIRLPLAIVVASALKEHA
jgi:signal transduction histidine kinase